MASKRELGFPKTSAVSLKERLARTTLKHVRAQGHTYVEIREDGKRFIFFCTLCLAPCYSDAILFDHLKGSLHTQRLSAAKVTLMGPNPWPFNDGVVFFDTSVQSEKPLVLPQNRSNRLLEYPNNDNNFAVVEYDGNGKHSGLRNGLDGIQSDGEVAAQNIDNDTGDHKVISGVLIKEEIADLKVRFNGLGKTGTRMLEKDDGACEVLRIWCEWLGKKVPSDEEAAELPDHDFAVVSFSYQYDLGTTGLFDDVKLLFSSMEGSKLECTSNKRRRSFSDPEDVSDSLSNQCASSGEDSFSSRFISCKTARRELRRQHQKAAERMCDICQQKILLDKDVAALMNLKTGKLACSSSNLNGAFHVYHISCIVHWILLCEYELITNPLIPEVKPKSSGKDTEKHNRVGQDGVLAANSRICSFFCPQCQGTGAILEGDKPEKANVTLSQMFKYKIKLSDARRAWMKNPEVMQNCSIGFHFPAPTEGECQEKVLPLKLLHFYSAEGYK